MIQSRLFLLRDYNFIHGALSDLKLFIDLELLHAAWKVHFNWNQKSSLWPPFTLDITMCFESRIASGSFLDRLIWHLLWFCVQSKEGGFPHDLWLSVSAENVSVYKRGEAKPLETFPYEHIVFFGAPHASTYKITVDGRDMFFETPQVIILNGLFTPKIIFGHHLLTLTSFQTHSSSKQMNNFCPLIESSCHQNVDLSKSLKRNHNQYEASSLIQVFWGDMIM